MSMQSLKSVKQQKAINTVESGEVTGERVAGARKKTSVFAAERLLVHVRTWFLYLSRDKAWVPLPER